MLYNWLQVFFFNGVGFWFLCYPFQLGVVHLGRGGTTPRRMLRVVLVLRRRSSKCGF